MFALALQNLTPTQFAVAVMVLAMFALVFGFLLMWIATWLTAAPIRVVRAALRRVEDGDLDTNLVEFDVTEKIFTAPGDARTEGYITGRFG